MKNTVIVDGRQIASQIQRKLSQEVTDNNIKLKLAVVLVGDNKVSARYVDRKVAFGQAIEVEVTVREFDSSIHEEELINEIERLTIDQSIGGVVVQLPLPTHLDTEKILSAIPASKDVDALGLEPMVESPVVEAVKEILDQYKVKVTDRQVVVVGAGRLVGRPLAKWFTEEGGAVELVTKSTDNLAGALALADIIVLGAGEPGLVKPDMIKEGAVLIDAATSEVAGRLAGDADPDCAKKCAVFTPVPGGVGPLTIAMLFKNFFDLVKRQS
ncbi:MAG: hypothetical protein A2589_02415 [Candidatus Vogelbacteria bacterium RIFOXYD1_FULL_46_19]|uniref:Bifunctional protein FolD n=1 Tax=Candidatus Vogelbacteria bacterium RIFOXYD1_FULL_46_19 TaxID=1802439 RepID=A0A1G2QGJ0_9BACT|nr:MAG: hypothetical protein A2589_02415 [Candidatus Vogelbacteria bacterium RIFOXYD1_FULL_46_19]